MVAVLIISGYFKIIDTSETNNDGKITFNVAIVDGATYNSENGSSGKSRCKVNNTFFDVEKFTLENITKTTTFVIKYTAANSKEATKATCEIITIDDGDTVPNDTKKEAYYQIGRAIIKNDMLTISQDHTTGIPQINWYLLCSEDDEE